MTAEVTAMTCISCYLSLLCGRKTKQHVKYFCVPVWAEMLRPQLWFRRVLRFCVLADCDRKSTDLEKLYNIFPTVTKQVAVTRISCKFKTFRSNVICVILKFECDTSVCHSDRRVTSLQVGLLTCVCVCVCVSETARHANSQFRFHNFTISSDMQIVSNAGKWVAGSPLCVCVSDGLYPEYFYSLYVHDHRTPH